MASAGEHARPRTGRARLVGIQGPANGHELVLRSDLMVLGRAEACDLRIPDPSVSRRHLELRRGAQGWLATDLGSGNGTGLNGRIFRGEVSLQAGDVLTIGDSRLRFEPGTDDLTLPAPAEDEDSSTAVVKGRSRAARGEPSVASHELPPARPGLGKRKQAGRPLRFRESLMKLKDVRKLRLLLVGALVVVVLPLCVLTALWVKGQREARAFEAHARAVDARFQEGKSLLRQQKWADARRAFVEVQALEPSFPVAEFIERADREAENATHLRDARAALEGGKLADGARALSRVSADTQASDTLRSLQTELQRKCDDRVYDAQVAFDRGDLAEAKRLAREVTAALPTHRGALALLERVDAPPPPPSATSAPVPPPTKLPAPPAKKKR